MHIWRSTTLLATLLAVVTLLWTVRPAMSVPIAVEDFESYAPAAQLHGQAGGTGWTGAWNVPNAARRPETTIIGSGLSYSGGEFMVDGGSRAMQWVASEAGIDVLATRPMPTEAGTIYMSFLYQNSANDESAPVGNDFIQIGPNDIADNPKISAMDRNGQLQLRSTTNSTANPGINTGFTSETGETYFMVLKAEKTGGSSTYNDITLYTNPVSGNESFNGSINTTVNSGLNLSSAAFTAIRKAFAEAGDTFLYDEIRVGTTFADVAAVEPSNMAVITTRAGDGADAHVQSGGSANTNFGSDPFLQVKFAQSPDFNRKSYLRFDLDEHPFTDLGDAELVLTVAPSLGNETLGTTWSFDVWGLNDGNAGETWGEGTITWNNAPANAPGGADVDLSQVFGGAPLATFDIIGAGTPGDRIVLSSEDFPELLDFISSDSDGQATFLITRSTQEFTPAGAAQESVVHRFFSSEGSSPAFLNVTQAIPEPASAMLLLMGAGALLRRRRRA